MSIIIKAICFYCGYENRFSEPWIAKMYTQCKECTDSRIKYTQIELNSYYDGQVVTKDPPAKQETVEDMLIPPEEYDQIYD